MRVLIIEDNAFNGFCLTRLLTAVNKQIHVIVMSDSLSALNYLAKNDVSLIILDGNLAAKDGLQCNGPALADSVWSTNPKLPIIAWTDSQCMRSAFAEVFHNYNIPFNEFSCWTKIVSQERIHQSLMYFAHQIEDIFHAGHLKKGSKQLYA